jgi:hypothetical protein
MVKRLCSHNRFFIMFQTPGFPWHRLLPPKAFGAVQSSTFMATAKSVAACPDEGGWNPGSHTSGSEALPNKSTSHFRL